MEKKKIKTKTLQEGAAHAAEHILNRHTVNHYLDLT